MRRHALGAVLALGALAVAALMTAATALPAGVDTARFKFAPSIDAPWANYGPGHGKDSPVAAIALCRSAPWDTTNLFPAPSAGEVDAIVNDPVNNTGASNLGCQTPQNESTIAVNPTDPNNLIAGANDYRVVSVTGLNDGSGWAYYSLNGGATWGNVQLPGLTQQTGGKGNFKNVNAAGDPVLAFGPDGTAYYANIVFSRTGFASGIVVSVSTDKGQTWSEPNMVTYTSAGNFLHDKEWIAAGPNGKVVVTWTRFNLGAHQAGYVESPIVGAISYDKGKTWNRQSFPISDDTRPFNQGSQVAFASNGDLYVAYEAGDPATGYQTDALVLARSTDEGRSFQQRSIARIFDDLDCYPVFNGRQTLTDMHFRLNSYPSLSINPTGSGPIALTWSDQQGVGTCGTGGTTFTGTTANKVKLVTGTWVGGFSAPTVVAPNAADKVFPSVATRGGTTVISYYTRAYAPTHNPAACNWRIADGVTTPIPAVEPIAHSVCLDYASSTLSGGVWGAEKRLTSDGSNPFVQFADGAFIGDYTHIAIGSHGKAHASWTDFRGRPGVTPNNQDVYVSSYTP